MGTAGIRLFSQHPEEGAFVFSSCKNDKEGRKKMKKRFGTFSVVILMVLCLLCTAGCQNKAPEVSGIWNDALYTEDTTLGSGSTAFTLIVSAEDKSITVTVNTDKETVGEALLEHNFIEGDAGDYGLYVKKVNGMLADYDVDQTYWAFYENDEYAMSGVDATAITAGVTYKLERTKG